MTMSVRPLAQPDLDQRLCSRRQFLSTAGGGLASIALADLLAADLSAAPMPGERVRPCHFVPAARRVISLFQSGAPSQIDLFDEKPVLKQHFGEELPESIRRGQRLTGMTAGQETHPVAPSSFRFQSHGQCGARISELLPHTAQVVDELCIVRSMHTDAINHDPAITFMLTGTEQSGRPSFGSWLSYGLGQVQQDLPTFVVMISQGTGRPNGQPLYDRLWGSGFIPSTHNGVKFRSMGDPVPYLDNPPGFHARDRRRMLDDLSRLNQFKQKSTPDPEIATRIAQYEMAFRMQSSVPELTDVSNEPEHIFDLYGRDARTPGTYAANCLLARRLAERGVRFVQLFHRGWDQHRDLPRQLAGQCRDTDQASAALIIDLKQRGLLEDTLVIWGGEFGRTVYCQEKLTRESYGRDHHPRCFSLWMAGGGIRPGLTWGTTDDFSYNIVEHPVSVHDLHATLLNRLGLHHEQLTYRYEGRHYRLTDVHGQVVPGICQG
jgi:hypothetical protein